jgi:plastocyanin
MFRWLSPLPIAAVLLIAGCGGSSSSSGASNASATTTPTSAPKGKVLMLSADPGGQLRFTKSNLTLAKPGTVTLRMTNPSTAGMEHAIAIDGNGVNSSGATVNPGGVSTVTVTLKKGTYTYFCPVPGHRAAGMVGTLTVQ